MLMASDPKSEKKSRRSPRAASSVSAVGGDGKSVILAAALKAFARDTFDGASLPEIARSAGIGGPLIHYHFGSKENLWRATVDFALQDLSGSFNTIAATARDLEPRDALRMLCRALANFSSQYPEHVLVLMNEVRTPGPRLSWVIEKHLRHIHKIMDDTIERAVEKGQIKSIPSAHLTNFIIGSVTHFFSISPLTRELYGIDPFDRTVADYHSDCVIEVIFRGIEESPARPN